MEATISSARPRARVRKVLAALAMVMAVSAVGIGTTMLLHCDVVVASETARLQMPFTRLALVPEACSTLLLPQRIGHARAFAMFALGQPMGVQEALSTGIATSVVGTDQLDDEARRLAPELLARPSTSLAETKALMRDAEALWSLMQREGAQFSEQMRSPEAMEAFMAFSQKRAPDFSKGG